MKIVFFAALGLIALGTVGCVGADAVDEEALDAPEDETEAAAAGEIKIEVESVDPVAPWVKRSALAGFTGTGYFEWTGGDKLNPPPQGVLTYTFNVPRAGNYIIGVRGRRDQAGVCPGRAHQNS